MERTTLKARGTALSLTTVIGTPAFDHHANPLERRARQPTSPRGHQTKQEEGKRQRATEDNEQMVDGHEGNLEVRPRERDLLARPDHHQIRGRTSRMQTQCECARSRCEVTLSCESKGYGCIACSAAHVVHRGVQHEHQQAPHGDSLSRDTSGNGVMDE